ncbi:hypothetical protein ACJRO7_030776 [Eucalyptus globulus]|uniref:ZF-HD dimerization-type domain-containing protein n=1 Tax=Eucalyptus globulus TaxID=34317 RepID=A0ABD3JI89_EUCGL
MDRGQNYVISPQTLDQPKPRIDHLLQPSIPTSSPPSVEFHKITASTQAMPLRVANFRYFECVKNHSVSLGNYAIDGCAEFMPRDEGTPEFFQCIACCCHLNFNWKEIHRPWWQRAGELEQGSRGVEDC